MHSTSGRHRKRKWRRIGRVLLFATFLLLVVLLVRFLLPILNQLNASSFDR